jgi:hypothetical protein
MVNMLLLGIVWIKGVKDGGSVQYMKRDSFLLNF